MSVDVVADPDRPMTAKPRGSNNRGGDAVAVKQMMFHQDPVEPPKSVSQQKTIKKAPPQTMHQQTNKKTVFEHKPQYKLAEEKPQNTFEDLVIQGAEMHILDGDQHQQQMRQTGGFVQKVGGQQAKAFINTVKQTNASRFYKGYAKKLAQHQEEKVEHYKSIYGEIKPPKENDKGFKSNQARRPQTAKSHTRGGQSQGKELLRNQSFKSIRDLSQSSQRKSSKNLAKLYGEKNEQLLRYEQEKELLRKRDETKAELKALLKKYISHQSVMEKAPFEEVAKTNGLAHIVGQA